MHDSYFLLVGFVLAQSVHSEEEFNEWGREFLHLMGSGGRSESQLQIDLDIFSNLFSSTYSVNETENDEGFVVFESAESFLKDIIDDLSSQSDEYLLEEIKKQIRLLESSGHYDARARTVTKRVLNILKHPRRSFSTFEVASVGEKTISAIEKRAFNLTQQQKHVNRVLRAGSAATIAFCLMVSKPLTRTQTLNPTPKPHYIGFFRDIICPWSDHRSS